MALCLSTPLTKAILQNDIIEFRKQLRTCEHVNSPNRSGWTPLHFAVQMNNIEMVKDLLKHPEVDVQCKTFDGDTSLHIACKSEEPDLNLAQLLISHGIEVNAGIEYHYTPLYLACKANHVELATLLIRNGADVNVQEEVHGSTPLYFAIELNSPDLVTLLLESGAKVTVNYNEKWTALTHALHSERFEIARILIPFVKDLDECAHDSWTPLHIAVNKESYDLCKLLLKHGANANICTEDEDSLLLTAIENDNYKIFELLWTHTDYNLLSGDNQFIIEVCERCTIQSDWCYFNTFINTPELRFDFSNEIKFFFYLFRWDENKDFETTKEHYYKVLDWFLKNNVKLCDQDLCAFLNHISECPYKTDLLKFVLDRSLPESFFLIQAAQYIASKDVILANILIQYMIPLPPSDIIYGSVTFNSGLKYMLSMFTPSFAMRESLLERLQRHEDIDILTEFTDILEHKINSMKSLKELARDYIIREHQFSNQKFVDIVEQMDIHQHLKDIIRYKVSVNNI